MDTISRLASWKMWMNKSLWLKEIFDFTFPSEYRNWVNTTGVECPICHDAKSFILLEDNKDYYCICEMLQWGENHDTYWGKYETQVGGSYLENLKPFIINNDDTGAKDLIKYKVFLNGWLKNLDSWIFVQGGVGTGKSTSFKAIKQVHPELTVFLSMDRFQQRLFEALRDNTVTELIRSLVAAPILIIDDWGLEHDSNWTTNTLANIVNARYLNGPMDYLTLASTNLSISTLLSSTSTQIQRIASRLADTEISHVFNLRQADYRSPATRKNRTFKFVKDLS